MHTHAPLALLSLTLLASSIHLPSPESPGGAERIRTDDNLRPAGTLRDGVLTLRLDARVAIWHPDGDKAPGAPIQAFAERGRTPQIPGPMIRVPAGTEVALTVTNSIAGSTLTLHGLVSRPTAADDTVQVATGASRQIRFRLDAPGTYYYWGTTTGRTFMARTQDDGQLSGAIVVDEPGADPRRDRVLVIGLWSDTTPSEFNRADDMERVLFVVNGRSWPHTTRLSYTVGDTVRLRVVNITPDPHPMHLHGFYFRVDSRGNGLADSTIAEARRDLAVTELLPPGRTMSLTWVPERAGNWLFHCHITPHFSPRGPLGTRLEQDAAHDEHGGNHAVNGMGGLVMGVMVAPRRAGAVYASGTEPPRRMLRLLVRENAGSTDSEPLFGFTLQDGATEPAADSGHHIGRPIILTRGQPVGITVVNRLREPTAVHWHGIELESYFDGVAGFSGLGRQLSPPIAPADSFVALFTPPRAGTFIYHTHVNERRQQPAGLTGALIVLEPGQHFDSLTDIPVLITSPPDPADEARAVMINGSLTPAPLELRAGGTYRLRMINITTARPGPRVELRRDTTLLTWRVLAKDGADLPAGRQMPRPARYPLSIGETMDVELGPTAAGDMQLSLQTPSGMVLGRLPMHVRQ